MAAPKVPPAKSPGCPARCLEGGPDAQRLLSDEEWNALPDSVRAEINFYGCPDYICRSCGTVYIHEPYLDTLLGKLKDGTNWAPG